MQFHPFAIPGIVVIEPELFQDERGFFFEAFQAEKYSAIGVNQAIVQENHSGSRGGVLRGLHYQLRHPQGKLVTAVVGEIFDVAIDMRRSSRTFGKWVGTRLSAENRRQVWIPPGFAHGYYVLSSWAEVTYKTTNYYSPQWERTLIWSDPDVNIEWPLLDGKDPILSPNDAQGSSLCRADCYADL